MESMTLSFNADYRESPITFKTALEIAQSTESAAKNLKELSDSSKCDTPHAAAGSTPTPQEPVHQITNTSAKSQQCYC